MHFVTSEKMILKFKVAKNNVLHRTGREKKRDGKANLEKDQVPVLRAACASPVRPSPGRPSYKALKRGYQTGGAFACKCGPKNTDNY